MLKLRKSTVSRFSTVEGENMAVSGFLPSRPFRVKQHDAVKKAAAKTRRSQSTRAKAYGSVLFSAIETASKRYLLWASAKRT